MVNSSKTRDPRAWKKWRAAGAVQDFSRGWATDGPIPVPANKDIYEHGTLVMVTSTIGSNAIVHWVKKVAKMSGQRVDWHWAGGRARILALGDLAKVRAALTVLIPEHDQLYDEACKKYL